MDCPACGHELTEIPAGPVKAEACGGGCGGLWFDQLELLKLDQRNETVDPAVFDVERAGNVSVSEEPRTCPRDGSIMMRFYYSPKRQVQVDHCPECGGHWLDAGELDAIRRLYASPEERAAHLTEIVQARFGDELDELPSRQRAEANKGGLRRWFGWLLPPD
jgi:hypothetical protein